MSNQNQISRLEQSKDSENGSNNMMIHHEQFSGPLPPPAILKKYDEVVPGAAERIIKMAEEQSRHRQSLEAKVISSDVVNSRLGLLFGFIIGISTIVGGMYLALNDKQSVGAFISFGGLATLAGVFVYGSKTRRDERESRQKES